MINLLPPQEMAHNRSERNKKLLLVLGNTVFISLIALVLVLLSVRFYILQEALDQETQVAQARADHDAAQQAFTKEALERYNARFTTMANFYATQTKMHAVLQEVVSIPRPEGLRLSSITIDRNATNGLNIVLSGVSPTRDSLLAYKDTLGQARGVVSVSFPAESWIQKENLVFTATIVKTLP